MRIFGLLTALAGLIVLPLISSGYVVYLANLLLTFTVLCLGMHIVIGEAGQFSLAQAAFYGIGIYTSGLANTAFGWPFPLSVILSGLVAALVACVSARSPSECATSILRSRRLHSARPCNGCS